MIWYGKRNFIYQSCGKFSNLNKNSDVEDVCDVRGIYFQYLFQLYLKNELFYYSMTIVADLNEMTNEILIPYDNQKYIKTVGYLQGSNFFEDYGIKDQNPKIVLPCKLSNHTIDIFHKFITNDGFLDEKDSFLTNESFLTLCEFYYLLDFTMTELDREKFFNLLHDKLLDDSIDLENLHGFSAVKMCLRGDTLSENHEKSIFMKLLACCIQSPKKYDKLITFLFNESRNLHQSTLASISNQNDLVDLYELTSKNDNVVPEEIAFYKLKNFTYNVFNALFNWNNVVIAGGLIFDVINKHIDERFKFSDIDLFFIW